MPPIRKLPRPFRRLLLASAALALAPALAHAADAAADAGAAAASSASAKVSEVVVTASRQDLLGTADTASQGVITRTEVELRPIFRVGQLYETVPGLVVTIHSGEGKANQYLLRGFNLDHGTDFASFVDAMPVNRPTNAHGQGYSDQNFLIPQIVGGLDYTKGPYYAEIGDFGSVGSTHVRLIDDLPNTVSATVGTQRDQELYAGGTMHFGEDTRLWLASAASHFDGPWSPPENFRKFVAAARLSEGVAADGFALTGMYYKSSGGLLTDQPARAIDAGVIDRFGTLDPTDRSESERFSLSGHFARGGDRWTLNVDSFAIRSRMVLWNNFTHFLFDPVNGDQEQQDEARTTLGLNAIFTRGAEIMGLDVDGKVGFQDRYDDIFIDRRHTQHRAALDYCNIALPASPTAGQLPAPADAHTDPDQAVAFRALGGACTSDTARLNDLGLFAEATVHWTDWLRMTLGLREEFYNAHDRSLTTGFSGSTSQRLLQPKGNIAIGPFYKTELYLSAGRGFHSEDVRGVFGTVPGEGQPGLLGPTPLVAPADGFEIGLRTDLIPKTQMQVAVFREDFESEQRYVADEGEDTASAPSRRQGVEVSAQVRPFPWLELNTDLAWSQAHYRASAATLAAFELDGTAIANAPSFIGSFGVLVNKLGPWSGGLQWRKLGAYPISDGDEEPKDKGYSEINLNVSYAINDRLKADLQVFNLADSHSNSSAYFYQTRVAAGGPSPDCDITRVSTCYQIHPTEPRSARFTLTYGF
jgi:outer membrane receptor protein involved in Fe transport